MTCHLFQTAPNEHIFCRDQSLPWTYCDAKEQPTVKKPSRKRRDCPVPGCTSSVLKMSQHFHVLMHVHALTEDEVQEYLVLAKTITPKASKSTELARTADEQDGLTGIGTWACAYN